MVWRLQALEDLRMRSARTFLPLQASAPKCWSELLRRQRAAAAMTVAFLRRMMMMMMMIVRVGGKGL